MKSVAIVMPVCLTGNPEFDDARQIMRDTWSCYTCEFPIIPLIMNYQEKYDNFSRMPNTNVLRTDQKYPLPVARLILSQMASRLGYEYAYHVDDDFIVDSRFNASLLSTVSSLSSDTRIWMQSSKRLLFTSRRRADVVLGHMKYVDDESKHIEKGVKIWEVPGFQESYVFREGIICKSCDYPDAMDHMLSIMSSDMYGRGLLDFEDAILLSWLALQYGLTVRRVEGVWHNFKQISSSLCWNDDAESPSMDYRKSRDVVSLLSEMSNVEQYCDELTAVTI
jgi:hypothetical protein